MIRLAEQKKAGTYNAVGPRNKQTVTEFVDEARKAFDIESSIIQIDDYEFLKEKNIHYIVPWIMSVGDNYGSARVNNTKTLENGLTLRALQTSIKDIHQWWYSDLLSDERRNIFELKPNSTLLGEQSIIANWNKVKS